MITKDMVVLDIIYAHPEIETVFHKYDEVLGECILCNHLFETLENVFKEKPENLVDILKDFNLIIESK